MSAENYVVDANVYIEAYRRYYAFDFGTKFWACLKEHSATGRVVSIDRVLDELRKGKDELADWACNTCCESFVTTDRPDVIYNFGKIMNWVQGQGHYFDGAKNAFAGGADGWLVAYAMAAGHTVVTHEEYNAEIRKQVKIPNVCRAFGIRYVNTFTMLRELGTKLA